MEMKKIKILAYAVLGMVIYGANVKALPEGRWSNDRAGHYIIDNCVNEIDHGEISDNKIIELTIPGSVKIIRSGAIKGCQELKYLNINAEIIEPFILDEENTLEKVTIMDNVKQLPIDQFKGLFDIDINGLTNLDFIMRRFKSANTFLTSVPVILEVSPKLNKGGNPIYNVVEENKNYCSDKEGILYDKAMKRLISVPSVLEGKLTTLHSVKEIEGGCFADTRLEEIVITDNVKVFKGKIMEFCTDYPHINCRPIGRLRLPKEITQLNDGESCDITFEENSGIDSERVLADCITYEDVQ